MTPDDLHADTAVPHPEPAGHRPVPPVLLAVSVAVSVLRLALPLAAIPLAAALIPDDVPTLLMLRPGKEVLLLGGGLNRTGGDPTVAALFAAYLPLMTVGVWSFFIVGRAYGPRLRAGTGPAWLQRAVPQERLILASRVLGRKGPTIAILGRLAALPPTILAAAAGASTVDSRRYLLADLVGMVLSFASTVALGYALGGAYERGGPWLTGAGVVLLFVVINVFTRWLQREAERPDAPTTDGPAPR